jgi:transcriptional regulator with GAF, ATPase, and Fis domain
MFDYIEIANQIALYLCSSCDLNESMREIYFYLQNIIPLDKLQITTYNQEMHAMEHLAVIDNAQIIDKPKISPLPPDVPKNYHFFQGDAYVFSETSRGDMPREYYEAINIEGKNDLSLKIRDHDKIAAFLVCRANRPDAYKKEHVELMKRLIPTFSLAVLNYLQIRKLEMDKNQMLSNHSAFQHGKDREMARNIACMNGDLRPLFDIAEEVAKLNTTVLITGETGVGKEVFANHIHNHSNYCKGPLINVNCGAIPESLIDSELFGHEKGAFTGADSMKKGKFELANMGTIFLDEIGELPLLSQVRLLRTIQFKEIERLGSQHSIKINVRIICATNRNLRELVQQGRFREDLFYRINVFPIYITPVRSRKNDIPELINCILSKKCLELGIKKVPEIPASVMKKLVDYSWPGNVREMENTIERELILDHNATITFENFFRDNNVTTQSKNKDMVKLNDVIYSHIESILSSTNGRIHGINGAAALLDVHPSTLRSMIKRLEKNG